MTDPEQLSFDVPAPALEHKKAARSKRLAPVCTLRCGAEAIRIFNVDDTTYVLANDVMRATGNHTASASVEHAVSTFPELQAEGVAILRPVEGMHGRANRLLTIEAAKALVARSRSRYAVDVQRWLHATFGGSGEEGPAVSPTFGQEGSAPPVTAPNLVRLELTVTIEKARRILAIAAK